MFSIYVSAVIRLTQNQSTVLMPIIPHGDVHVTRIADAPVDEFNRGFSVSLTRYN